MFFFFTADLRVHEFFKTPYFKTGIHPLPGAKETLHKLSGFCNLSVVTYVQLAEFLSNFLCLHEHGLTCFGMYAKIKRSRQNAIKDHTIQWIESHFPGLFQEIHFGNHFALHGESRPKSEICRYVTDSTVQSGCGVQISFSPNQIVWCMFACLLILWSTL